MDQYKIIQVKESVFADNDREADRVRQQLKGQGTFLLNLMSSPGSGKTTTLLRTVEGLKISCASALWRPTSTPTWTLPPWRAQGSAPSSCTPAAYATWTPA